MPADRRSAVLAASPPVDGVRPRSPTLLSRTLAGLDQRRLLVLVVFAAIFAYDLAQPTDIDFWWHLRTGELIARSGAVPTADPFSYTALGQPWVVHEWLWELAVYGVYQLGGYALATLLSAAIVALTYGILYRLLRQLGANELVAAALVLWASALALPSVGVRPREVTHLFLALYVSRLLLYRAGRVRRLWWLPPTMTVWVNVHGPFVLGLGALGIFVAAETLRWLVARGPAPRHLWLVGLLTLAATGLNPAGPRMLLYPVGYYLQAGNPSFANVTEFQSPDFHEPLYLAFAGSLLALMLLGSRRPNLADSLLIAAFALQALVSVRHVAVYAVVAAPLLTIRLVERFRLARELPRPRPGARLVALNWALLAALVLLAGASVASRPGLVERLQLGREPRAAASPVAGARYIEEHDLSGPVFNYQPWGGYLLHRWYPGRLVFIDGRVDMYGPGIVGEYRTVTGIRPGWREVLDRYDIQTILVDRGSPLSTLLLADGGWDRVFEGPVEEVFARRR